MEKTNVLKVAGAAALGLVVGGAGIAGTMEPEVVTVENTITEIVENIVEVEVPVEVEVIKEVNVTDSKLGDVIQHIFDRDGDVEYIVDEYDADEVDQIADAFLFVHEMVAEGSSEIKKELADELDREIVNGVELDEDDIERIRISDDLDEVTLEDFDAEDGELDITYDVRFEHDDVDYEAVVRIEVRDGEVDDIEIVSVNEE